MSIEIRKFTDYSPTDENIEQIVELTKQDLIEGGLTDEEILAKFDKKNPVNLAGQRAKVEKDPHFYTGAFEGDDLVAIAATKEWLSGDDVPFETIPQLAGVFDKMRRRLIGPHLRGEPLGIFALVVSGELELPNRKEVGNTLLNASLEGKNSSEVRIPLHANDPLKDAVIQHEFKPTDKYGTLLGVRQQLYIRPPKPKARSEQDQ